MGKRNVASTMITLSDHERGKWDGRCLLSQR